MSRTNNFLAGFSGGMNDGIRMGGAIMQMAQFQSNQQTERMRRESLAQNIESQRMQNEVLQLRMVGEQRMQIARDLEDLMTWGTVDQDAEKRIMSQFGGQEGSGLNYDSENNQISIIDAEGNPLQSFGADQADKWIALQRRQVSQVGGAMNMNRDMMRYVEQLGNYDAQLAGLAAAGQNVPGSPRYSEFVMLNAARNNTEMQLTQMKPAVDEANRMFLEPILQQMRQQNAERQAQAEEGISVGGVPSAGDTGTPRNSQSWWQRVVGSGSENSSRQQMAANREQNKGRQQGVNVRSVPINPALVSTPQGEVDLSQFTEDDFRNMSNEDLQRLIGQ